MFRRALREDDFNIPKTTLQIFCFVFRSNDQVARAVKKPVVAECRRIERSLWARLTNVRLASHC